jgi:rhodanese-related sulfurtransferase
MGRVTRYPSPDTQTSYDHFATKLGVETDATDVQVDLQAGAYDFVVVDARSEDAFVQAHIPGAIHLAHATIDREVATHFLPDKHKVVVVYGAGPHCNAGDKGAVILTSLGYKVKVMIGGMDGWRHEGYDIEGTEYQV